MTKEEISITPVGKIEQLRVPRDRDGTFTTEVFKEYHRSTGEMEDAVREMWLQGISQRNRRQLVAPVLSKSHRNWGQYELARMPLAASRGDSTPNCRRFAPAA
ncbi:MAG: transposase [Armatimonadetes bacterium]|nr:transposase [Armatimonadota bacterium]